MEELKKKQCEKLVNDLADALQKVAMWGEFGPDEEWHQPPTVLDDLCRIATARAALINHQSCDLGDNLLMAMDNIGKYQVENQVGQAVYPEWISPVLATLQLTRIFLRKNEVSIMPDAREPEREADKYQELIEELTDVLLNVCLFKDYGHGDIFDDPLEPESKDKDINTIANVIWNFQHPENIDTKSLFSSDLWVDELAETIPNIALYAETDKADEQNPPVWSSHAIYVLSKARQELQRLIKCDEEKEERND